MILGDHVYVYEGTKWVVLCNLKNGAVDLLTPIEWKIICKLSSSTLKKEYPTLFNNLIERGYIKDHRDSRNFVNPLKEQESHSKIVYMVMTQNCNLRCKYCNQWNMPRVQEILAPPKIDAAINIIKCWIDNGDSVSVVLFGGEPLLPATKPSVSYLFDKLRKIDIDSVEVITNGTMIQFFKRILLENKDLINGFQITLDGPREIHNNRRIFPNNQGTFDKIVENINWLLENGFYVTSLTVVDNENINYLPELARFYKEMEWINNEYFSATIGKVMYPLGNIPPNSTMLSEAEFIQKWHHLVKRFPELLDIFDGILMGHRIPIAHFQNVFNGIKSKAFPAIRGCSAVTGQIQIFSPDGLVYPCVEVIGWKKFAIARYFPNIEQLPAHTLWNGWNVLNFDKCKVCKYLNICGGGCPLSSIEVDSMGYKDPSCPSIEEMLRAYFAYAEDVLIPKLLNSKLKKERIS